MVRAVIQTRVRRGQRHVLLPGATEAEPWELWSVGAEPRCVKAGIAPDELAIGNDTTLALPVGRVLALPLWLQETDPRQFPAAIELQIEARGLQSRTGRAVCDWSIVEQEEKRTLVLAGVLPMALPEEFQRHVFAGFDLAARCFALPADAVTFWMEQGRLALAVTRGEQLAYFQTLADPTLTPRAVQDLTCILAALQYSGVASAPRAAVFWTDSLPAGADQLAALRLSTRLGERPPLKMPDQPWSLTPSRVNEVKRGRTQRRWWRRVAALVLLLVLAALAAAGWHVFQAAREVAELQKWQAAHANDLQMVQQTESAWNDLQPVVNPNRAPLEILLHVAGALPPDQVHLTLFESNGDHLLIKAEAKNLTAAFQFFDRVKKEPGLAGYTWQMAQPRSLANDITQLQIEATHASRH